MLLQTDWTRGRLKPNDLVNQVRGRLQLWRDKGRPGTTATTRALLEHWTDPDQDPTPPRQVETLARRRDSKQEAVKAVLEDVAESRPDAVACLVDGSLMTVEQLNVEAEQ